MVSTKICKNVVVKVCKDAKKPLKKTVSSPKKVASSPKKPPKKTVSSPKKTASSPKKTTSKKSVSITTTQNTKISVKQTKKSKIKNKILAAIAAAGLLGIGYIKVIAPILEKSRIAKEEAALALSQAKTEEEKASAQQEYVKRDNLLQIQESIGNEIIEKESSPEGVEETRPLQATQGPSQFNTLDESRRIAKEEAFRRQQEIIQLKREAYKKNVDNFIQRNNVRTEAKFRREEAKRAAFQKNVEARQLAFQARNSAFQRLSEIRQKLQQNALESKIKAEESKKIAEESRRISAETAAKSRRASMEKAEEAKKIAEESRKISTERAAESRRASLQKLQELSKRASSKSAEFRDSLNRKALELKQRLSYPRPSNSQLPRYTALEQQALEQAQASAVTVSTAVANLPVISQPIQMPQTPNIVPQITENRIEEPVSITGIFKELVASPMSESFPSTVSTSLVDRGSRRRNKKTEALNSGPCSKAEEQSLRDKSRKLSFGSNNFSKRIGECGVSGIKGISIDGEYFECISGPSGAQEMKEEYLDSINNLIIKAKVCSDKRVKNENSIYFENIRNAKPKVKDY